VETILKLEKANEYSLDAPILEIVINAMPDGLFAIDRSGRIILWNIAMERITGYGKLEAIGRKPSMLAFQYRTGEMCPNDISRCGLFKKGQIINLECNLKHKKGWFVPVLKNARVIKDSNGHVIGAVETVTDLTAIRGTQRNVYTSRKKLYNSMVNAGDIIGKSSCMQKIYNAIGHAAACKATVLIQGESGTGKELVANAIHYHSKRASKKMMTVNCSAIPESLLESELFGHIKGAFTGAINDRIGRFEEADGGTVFLDEIGDISPLIQIKLLRVIEEQIIERVGESTPRKIDIRIIAATNKNIEEQVRKGLFREDLYYRLKVFTINMPPLRDRKDDIPLLVDHFIERFNHDTGRNITSITENAMRILLEYQWPGNVRELENAILHAFVVRRNHEIQLFDLPVEIRRFSYPNIKHETYDEQRKQLTKEKLISLLSECGWNKSEVARRLNCSHTSIWKYMKKWSIPLRNESNK